MNIHCHWGGIKYIFTCVSKGIDASCVYYNLISACPQQNLLEKTHRYIKK